MPQNNKARNYIITWAELYKSKATGLACPVIKTQHFTCSGAKKKMKSLIAKLNRSPTVLYANIVTYVIEGRFQRIPPMEDRGDMERFAVVEVEGDRITLHRMSDYPLKEAIDCKIIERVDPTDIGEALANDCGAIPPWAWAEARDGTVYKILVDHTALVDPQYSEARVIRVKTKQQKLA